MCDLVGFHFEIIYRDAHLLEVRISASNRAFSGVAAVYVGLDELEETAAMLRRFPSSPSDVREINLGAFGPGSAPGRRVTMRFYCSDRSGHAHVDSTIESEPDATGKVQSVKLLVAVEAAAVDSFVEELVHVSKNQAGIASLRGVSSDAERPARTG